MDESREWKEYKLDVSLTQDRFNLIKNHLVRYVDEHSLRFWVTNYFDPEKDVHPHMRFRVYVTPGEKSAIECHLDSLVDEGILIRRHQVEPWAPYKDAENRIRGNRREFDQTKEYVTRDGYYKWLKQDYLSSLNPDLDRTEELAALFEAVGEATKAFYKVLPRKPVDPYVMSLTLHILLNSLTYGGPKYPSEETGIRGFPVI